MTHKQWLFRNAHVHYKKLDGLTVARHEEIFCEVEQMMEVDPDELLPRHVYLLDVDFEALGEATSGDWMTWMASMKSACEADEHYRSRDQVVGDPNVFCQRKFEIVPWKSGNGCLLLLAWAQMMILSVRCD